MSTEAIITLSVVALAIALFVTEVITIDLVSMLVMVVLILFKVISLEEGIQGFRSSVTYVKGDTYISTGTSGTDISYNGGKSWSLLDSIGFNAILINSDLNGVAVGSYGRVAEVELQ